MSRERGFSLLELVIVLAILAIVLALAIPTFSRTKPDERLREATTELAANLRYARSIAVSGRAEGAAAVGTLDAVDVAFDDAANTYTITAVNLTTGVSAQLKTVAMSNYQGAELDLVPTILPTPATPVRFGKNGAADRIATVTLTELGSNRSKEVEITRAGLARIK
ncbi:prepilin-type N-terminal cleavage/methylation domain-containing protein [Myxococcota bacterium]|nr:prepilin-type N-terminal cleavage/methylation domain-containing protein [Myxococcota bacterium]